MLKMSFHEGWETAFPPLGGGGSVVILSTRVHITVDSLHS